MKMNAGENNF